MTQTGRGKTRMTALSPSGRRIQETLAAFLRREPSTIKPEHRLRDDLGLDSLMTFELLYEFEKTFDLEIPNEDLPGLQTLADIASYVDARLHASMPSAGSIDNASRTEDKPRRQKAATATTKKAPVKSKPKVAAKGKKPGPGSTTKKRETPAKPERKKP